MLNENLKNEQSQAVEIMDCQVRVGNTGIAAEDSVNLGPRRQAKQRTQRMRRRHERALFSGKSSLGWATRMI